MKSPQIEDIEIAIMWLNCNEGEEEELGAIRRVSSWLESIIEKKKKDEVINSIKKEFGLVDPQKIKYLKKIMKQE